MDNACDQQRYPRKNRQNEGTLLNDKITKTREPGTHNEEQSKIRIVAIDPARQSEKEDRTRKEKNVLAKELVNMVPTQQRCASSGPRPIKSESL